ncbi:MAG: pilus assembly protein N-terminal domain-containing protein [Terracidiphilus sp.]
MRAKTSITIACFSVFSLLLCAGAGLKAQTSPTPAQAAGVSSQDSANDLSVAVGKTVLVDTAWPIKRVANNLSEIADVHPTSPTEIMVQGKAPGETSVIVWDTHGGRQFFNVTVRASSSVLNDNLDSIRRELRTELPGQTLKITSDNGMLFLRGTVKDLDSSARAVKIASTGGKVVNLLNIEVPPSDPQILLKVHFISVDRTKEQQLGINLFTTGLGNTLGNITTGQFSPPSVGLPNVGSTTVANGVTTILPASISSAAVSNELNLFAFYPGLNLGATIEALESKVGGQVLAEPNLLATNGKQASFLAGGEYPYPMVQGGSGGVGAAITIMFKEYGVRLNFIPTVTPRGTIRLQVAPEVSALDFGDAVEISGFEVPAITTRKVKTEVELADGQSFVIGGLLNNTESDAFQKIPFLGDIPILGKFFQSMQRTKSNTELIVIVTPEVVAPIQAGDPLPSLKFPAKFLPPNSGIPMNTPDAKTAANTPPPAPQTLPVEKLIDTMKPETPLVIDSGTGGFGAGGGASAPASNTSPVPEVQTQ